MLKNYASGSHYTAGRMNSIVYPVTGGMEDWAYAASWENAPATPCQPTEHGGYDVAKTTYTSDMLNTFNILVETANYKDPWRYSQSSLGQSGEVLRAVRSRYDGHTARNIRLCLMMTDMVMPYIVWQDAAGKAHAGNQEVADIAGGDTYTVAWDVGGALKVDETHVLFIRISQDDSAKDCSGFSVDSITQATRDDNHFETAPGENTIWSDEYLQKTSTNPSACSKDWSPYKPRYTVSKTFTDTDAGMWVAVAGAMVDQDWGKKTSLTFPAGMPPKSHVVRSRTEDDYTATVNGHTLKGRKWWYAQKPRCVKVVRGAPPTPAPTPAPAASTSTTAPSTTTSASTTTASSVVTLITSLLTTLAVTVTTTITTTTTATTTAATPTTTTLIDAVPPSPTTVPSVGTEATDTSSPSTTTAAGSDMAASVETTLPTTSADAQVDDSTTTKKRKKRTTTRTRTTATTTTKRPTTAAEVTAVQNKKASKVTTEQPAVTSSSRVRISTNKRGSANAGAGARTTTSPEGEQAGGSSGTVIIAFAVVLTLAATVGYCVVSRKKTASYGTLGNTLDSNYANPSFQQGGGGSRFSIASDEDDVDDLYLRKPSGGQNDRQWFSSLRND